MKRNRIADYTLVEEMGVGSTGILYKANCPPRLRIDADVVAVKILDKHASDDDFRRFANEIRLFVAAASPHLVRVHDAGHEAGILYYAMEYFPRGSLEMALDRENPTVKEIVRAVAEAARGAHALHEVGVAHRDIKPSNILLGDGVAKLADLGLAQLLDPGSIVTGTGPIGSIEFMPPSMVRGEQATRASDIWELGATLHKALTGRSVYGDIPTTTVLAALRHVIQTVPRVSDELDGPLRDCIARSMAADAFDRQPTALAFAEELEATL